MGRNTVSIDVDLNNILPDISTENLKDELDRRLKAAPSFEDKKKDIAEALRGGDRTYLRIVLDRWIPGLGDMI